VAFHEPPIWLWSFQSNFFDSCSWAKKERGRYCSAFFHIPLPTHKPSPLKTLTKVNKCLAVLGRDPSEPASPQGGPPAPGLCSAGPPPPQGCGGWTATAMLLPSHHVLSGQAQSPGPGGAGGRWEVAGPHTVLTPSKRWVGEGTGLGKGERAGGDRPPHLLQNRCRLAPHRQSRVRTQCRHGDRSMARGAARPRGHPGRPAPRWANLWQPLAKPQPAGRMRRAAAEALPSLRRHAMFYV